MNKIKALPQWQKVTGAILGAIILIMVLLIVRVVLKAELGNQNATVQASSTKEDYFSYHGPKLIQLDKDMTSLVNDLLKMNQGDASSEVVTDLSIQSGSVDRDIIDLQAYSGNVPAQYEQSDQLFSESLNDLMQANQTLTSDIQNNNVPAIETDLQNIINGRNLYKQAADSMISAHKNQ